jgi:ABC-type phosphate/phosphonate transport system substrate-binding protein
VNGLIANARMYAVTPAVEEGWKELLGRIFGAADLHFDYAAYPAPQPMEGLWERPDLGCVFMCGFPIALRMADIRPIAAPVPSLPWAKGKPHYRSDLIVRADAPFQRLEDTFGLRAAWTVEHSHSGFNAFRHHLLPYRSAARPNLYGSMAGHLVTARRILDSVREGAIDIGPLDGYWHALIGMHAPHLVENLRVLASTSLAPMPAFVTGPRLPDDALLRLKQSFAAAHQAPWFADFADTLLLDRFAPIEEADYAPLLAWRDGALAAGYALPA